MNNVRVKPNEAIFSEVERVIERGGSVTIRTKGSSMLPFIVGGRDSVVLSPLEGRVVSCGDIILFKIDTPTRYILHRVIKVDGDLLTIMGDGNYAAKESCTTKDVIAIATTIIRKEKEVDPQSKKEQRLAKIWRALLPFRRYILYVYRHTR